MNNILNEINEIPYQILRIEDVLTHDFGIQTRNSDGTFRTLYDVLNDVSKIYPNLDDTRKKVLKELIFDKYYSEDRFKELVELSLHPWRDITDCFRDEMNREIRKEIMKELNKPLSSTEDLEIEQILQEELRKYEHDKAEFEANPLNWSNNKRRRFGLPTLRGSFNKNRKTKFHSFKTTPRIFFALEETIEDILPQKLEDNFKQFADVKDINFGEPYVSINPADIANLNNRKMDNYDTKEAFRTISLRLKNSQEDLL